MIYAPLGLVWPKAVVDPSSLLREYYEAMRVAQRATQYQISDGNALGNQWTDINQVVRGESVNIMEKSVTCRYNTAPTLSPDHTADVDTFVIPYNSAYVPVPFGGGATPAAADYSIAFTSKYPELILIGCSFQYYRAKQGAGDPIPNHYVRAKTQLTIDDVPQVGTGPYAHNIDTQHRGTGLANRAAAPTCVMVAMVPAGIHNIGMVAGQGNGTQSTSEDAANEDAIASSAPDTNVTIGNRKLFVLRFAKGAWLTP